MRVLLIEDHPIVRSACKRLLAEHEVLEAASAAEGERLAAEAAPAVIVLDLNLPDAAGLAVLSRLLKTDPKHKVIVFSMFEEAGFVRGAIEAGALGYVTKSDDPEALADAVAKAARGEIYLGATAARVLALAAIRPVAGTAASQFNGLSKRERDVLALLGEGRDLAEVAACLHISYRSSASIVAGLRAKLEAPSTAALIKLAVEAKRNGMN
jgi:DNA-binding NarL/FixJ family response regulator